MTHATCSWCHDIVVYSRHIAAVYCSACGHRADVARRHCDCLRCTRREPPGITEADVEQALRELEERGR